MITYADVQRIYRSEGNTPTLEEIPADFYSQIPELLSKVEAEHKSHIIKFLGEIYTKRRNKIMLHALRTGDKNNLPRNATLQERALYTEAVDLLQKHADLLLSASTEQKHETLDKPEERLVKIRMLKPMPSIVGSDLKNYGPLKEDDVLELPESNALILIKHDFAAAFEETPANAGEE
jgi:DNA replication initiation complex subunit (GINS family)